MKKLDPKKYRDNPPAIAEFLSKAFEENEPASIMDAIKFVFLAQNVKALSEASGMYRPNLYRTFGGKVDPPLSRVINLFDGLDIRLVVKPIAGRESTPRPKLGRPKKSARTLVKKLQSPP